MYSDFAKIYDKLMEDVDYPKFVDYYIKIFEKYNVNPKIVLDLACGTGTITKLMAQRGYDMIGLDLSVSMLDEAKSKSEGLDILYINQDMTDFELYGTVGAIVSSLDAVNHVVEKEDLARCFKLVNNYLDPMGLFIFDINSEYKIKNILGNNTFVYDDEDIFYTWQNFYDDESKICDFVLTFFVKNGSHYERIDDEYSQRAYTVDEIKELLEMANLKVLGVFDELSFNAPKEDSERIFFVAQKQST